MAQQDPAMRTISRQMVETYLRQGPPTEQLPDGSASASWAIMERVGLPELLQQEPLKAGEWATIWAPISGELEKRAFSGLDPLEVATWWEETRKEPQRFLRLLVQRGQIDARVPAERKRGEALREALDLAVPRLDEVRANVRFEKAGWSFTGTVSLVPSQRIVRLALRGSQPCPNTGKSRAANLALKGRLFLDKASPDGVKVQILEDEFTSNGCEETLKGRLSAMLPLEGMVGEARVTGNLILQLKDETVTGRLQLDLAYRPSGGSLQTAHGTYSLRGAVAADGSAHATLTPISTSGSKALREGLNKAGTLEAQVKAGQGSGSIGLSFLGGPLTWRATR